MAATYTLEIEAGATFDSVQFRYLEDDKVTPVNLTGWTARAQIRKTAAATLEIELDTTISGGLISIAASAVDTALLTERNYVWALELEHTDGTVIRLVQGKVYVSPEVVR
jgi:hypothetical protein